MRAEFGCTRPITCVSSALDRTRANFSAPSHSSIRWIVGEWRNWVLIGSTNSLPAWP